MSFKQDVADKLQSTPAGRYLFAEPHRRLIAAAAFSFLCNLAYALYYGVVGFLRCSLWFTAMCAYYAILSIMRFSAVLCGRNGGGPPSLHTEYFVMKLSGALLALLSAVLSGVVYISLSRHIATPYHKIIMITTAAYTFGKVTMAAVRAVKQRRDPSPLLAVIRSIGYAEVAASVLTLQRSMLVSFGSRDERAAQLLNAMTGAFVSLFVFLLGVSLIIRGGQKRKEQRYGKIQNRKSK